ncbi:hypothetical protein JDF658_24600, partial [Carboxydocella sp. JDF658]
GCEKVDSLDYRQLIIDTINSGIIGGIGANQDIGVIYLR